MPSRWLQQKLIKRQRMRRAWAKPYSIRGGGPDKFPMSISLTKDADGNPMRSITDIGIKGRSKVAKNYLTPFLLTRFKYNPNSNEAIYARTMGLHSDLDPNSKEIILAKRAQGQRHASAGTTQGEVRFVKAVMHDRPTSYLVMFISSEFCFFLEARITETKGMVFLKSHTYLTKQIAKRAYIDGKILWDEIEFPSSADTS